ncbi:MAG: general secretion pathway protein GspB [Gammaproteobacteria bacterium]
MSLILDALRKSERTRQQTLTGRVSAADAPPAHTRMPIPWATLIGLLLIANAVVLGIIFWRSHSSTSVPAPPVTQATRTAPSVAEPVPAYRPEIRSLAMEAAAVSTPPVTPANAVVTAAAVISAKAASTHIAPAAPVTAPAAAAASSGNSANPSQDNAPPLDTLPLAFQQSLPPLHLDVHSYSANPAERFVVINMQRYQTGDTLKEGPKVIAIVPDGVVLEYNGQQFLLPRP